PSVSCGAESDRHLTMSFRRRAHERLSRGGRHVWYTTFEAYANDSRPRVSHAGVRNWTLARVRLDELERPGSRIAGHARRGRRGAVRMGWSVQRSTERTRREDLRRLVLDVPHRGPDRQPGRAASRG